MRLFNFLTIAFLMFLCGQAFAVDYLWTVSAYGKVGTGASPSEACSSWKTAYSGGGYSEAIKSGNDWQCWHGTSAAEFYAGSIGRSGDSCPVDTVYNDATGVCEQPIPDPCESSIGNSVTHSIKFADISADGHLANINNPPDSVCSSSCSYISPSQVSCYRFTSGDPAGVFCTFDYRGDGQSCTAGPATPAPIATISKEPTVNDSSVCTEKVYDAEGRIHYTCQTTKEFTEPGTMNCGQVDGKTECFSKSPSPKHESQTETVDVTETPNADGSKDTTSTTTTNTTVCSGAGACTTTTTTSTSSTHTNADGTKGATTETCSGPGCKDSDGKTQDDRKEEEEAKPSVSGAESCDAVMACTGDVMQCEILTQLKDERCRLIQAQDYESNKQTITDAVAGSDYQMSEETTQIPSFVSSGVRFLPSGSCPSPSSVTVAGQSISFDYGPFCSFAAGIAPVVVGVSLLLAALYVGRGLGG